MAACSTWPSTPLRRPGLPALSLEITNAGTVTLSASDTDILGADTLTGYTGGNDIFADTAGGLNGDSMKNWTTGDVIDVKDFSAATLAYASNTLAIGNGGTSAAIKFSAALALHNFTVLGSDRSGGTLIGYRT